MLVVRTVSELRDARVGAGLSREQMAQALDWSASALLRVEADRLEDVGVIRLCEMASVLGCELSIGLHPIGDPIRDKGQQAVGARLDAILAPLWRVTNETLLPGGSELRSWDKLLRLKDVTPRHLVGVDIETRIRDIQELVRRTRLRERDGETDAILIVLSDSAVNRRLVDQLRDALGPGYATSPRLILRALRAGERLPGSGVILV
jgi:transcriptional regulator with XRE-family HTH domain